MGGRGRKRLFTDEQLLELYEQGLNDREIGDKLGAHKNTVSHHRRRLGLVCMRDRMILRACQRVAKFFGLTRTCQ